MKSKDSFTPVEEKLFERLDSPRKIQDYLDGIRINFEQGGDTLYSPRYVIHKKRAHCLEAALFAAAALWYHGKRPLLLDLKASSKDFDHVVTLFRENGYWGAVSKTNHAVLRYREPVYKTVRELALSYFHEYFNDDGIKTLRSFSKPFSLARYGTTWITESSNLWDIGADLDDSPHIPIISPSQARRLRHADPIEIRAGKLVEYKHKYKV